MPTIDICSYSNRIKTRIVDKECRSAMLAGARAAERQLINKCPSNSSLASRRVFVEIAAQAQVFRGARASRKMSAHIGNSEIEWSDIKNNLKMSNVFMLQVKLI